LLQRAALSPQDQAILLEVQHEEAELHAQ
jgi:hypothetical protein